MQSLIKNVKKFRLIAIENLFRNEIESNLETPIVSFTFDDFPKTAFINGAKILEKYNVKGTYYTAFGLVDSVYEIGKAFGIRDVKELIERGHEIGCHTYSHLSLKSCFGFSLPFLGSEKYRNDITRNRDAYRKIAFNKELNHFSYPHGVIALRTKRICSKYFKTCRGTIEGINARTIDLNLLKANCLYSNYKHLEEIISLIDENVYMRGWLIFYTHDISSDPSSWGCTLKYFEKIVERASEFSEVLTIEEAYQKIYSRKASLS